MDGDGSSEDGRKAGPSWNRLKRKPSVHAESMHFEGHLLHRACGVTGELRHVSTA